MDQVVLGPGLDIPAQSIGVGSVSYLNLVFQTIGFLIPTLALQLFFRRCSWVSHTGELNRVVINVKSLLFSIGPTALSYGKLILQKPHSGSHFICSM